MLALFVRTKFAPPSKAIPGLETRTRRQIVEVRAVFGTVTGSVQTDFRVSMEPASDCS